MSNNDTDKKIAVMQAFTRGNKIECKHLLTANSQWLETTLPAWDWKTWEYRVKPETRIVYRLQYSDGSTWESAGRQAAISRWCDAHEHGFHPTLGSFEIQTYE